MQHSEAMITSQKLKAFQTKRCFTYIAYTLLALLAGCYFYFVLFTKPVALISSLPLVAILRRMFRSEGIFWIFGWLFQLRNC